MKKLILFFFLLVAASSLFAQVKIGAVNIGGKRDDECVGIIQTKDKGYAMVGYTDSYGGDTSIYAAYIVKLDTGLNIQWARVIDSCYATGIVQTKDGGYAVVGYTKGDFLMVKLDSFGNVTWAETIGGGGETGYGIVQTKDGGYALTGMTSKYGDPGAGAIYVVKLDSTGAMQWSRAVGGPKGEEGFSIVQAKDGGYAVTGQTQSYGFGNTNTFTFKLDSAGNLMWTFVFGGGLVDYFYSIIQTNDGGYAMTGYTFSFGVGLYNVLVLKLDSSGYMQWVTAIGDSANNQVGRCIVQQPDGSYAIAGSTSGICSNCGAYLIKLNSNGALKWAVSWAGSKSAQSMTSTLDGGFALVGCTNINSAGRNDFYLIKTDSLGNTCSPKYYGGVVSKGDNATTGGSVISMNKGIVTKFRYSIDSGAELHNGCYVVTDVNKELLLAYAIDVYPNPCNGLFTIQVKSEELIPIAIGIKSTVEIYNVLGEKVYDNQFSTLNSPFSINLKGSPAGIYFVRVYDDEQNFIASTKIIIE